MTNPLHIHSPPAPGIAFDCVARSWGRGWPGACEGPPGGLGLDPSEDDATLEKPGAERDLDATLEKPRAERDLDATLEKPEAESR